MSGQWATVTIERAKLQGEATFGCQHPNEQAAKRSPTAWIVLDFRSESALYMGTLEGNKFFPIFPAKTLSESRIRICFQAPDANFQF